MTQEQMDANEVFAMLGGSPSTSQTTEPKVEEEVGNSEPNKSKAEEVPEASEAPSPEPEANKGSIEAEESKEPEAKPTEAKVEKNHKHTRLEKAEYTATKYKQKYRASEERCKAMEAKYNELAEKYNKLNQIDRTQLSEDDQRKLNANLIAMEQRAYAMQDDIKERREDLSGWKQEIWIDEGKDHFDEDTYKDFCNVANTYNEALDYAISQDTTGVVSEFLEESDIAHEIKYVLMKDSTLAQNLLTRKYRSDAMEGQRILSMLNGLSNSIKNYKANQNKPLADAPKAEAKPESYFKDEGTNKPKVTGSLVRGNTSTTKTAKDDANDIMSMMGWH